MSHSSSQVIVHVVFSTKNRHPALEPRLERSVHEAISKTVHRLEGTPFRIGGMPDHVHVLASLPRAVSIADFVKEIKVASCMRVRSSDGTFAWQGGYFVTSVSPSQRERVERYVADQKRHHASRDLASEIAAMSSIIAPAPTPNRPGLELI